MSLNIMRALAIITISFFAFPLFGTASQQEKVATKMDQNSSAQKAGTALAQAPLIYIVRYRPGTNYQSEKPLLKQDLREHGKYMSDHTSSGTIIAAGPTFDQAGGLVLISVRSLAEAEAFVRKDPAVVAGIFAGEITDWRPVFDSKSIFREIGAPR